MEISGSVIAAGIAAAIVSGILNGVFTLPMKHLGDWPWENVWGLVSFDIIPLLVGIFAVPRFHEVLAAVPTHIVVGACLLGFAWGFGSIMFGLGISAIGISMAITLSLAISVSFGSLFPIVILDSARLLRPQGIAIIAGTGIGLVGVVCFGYAGFRKERSQEGDVEAARGGMVGRARPFVVGLALCAGSGVLAGVLNIGYSLAQPIRLTAIRMGLSGFAGTCLIWMLVITCGQFVSSVYCAYLLTKNKTWKKFAAPGAWRLFVLSIGMEWIWLIHTYLYGYASPKLGKLGPAIGWPLTLMAGLIAANVVGLLSGEWKFTSLRDRQWMGLGILITIAAVVVLGWSSTLS